MTMFSFSAAARPAVAALAMGLSGCAGVDFLDAFESRLGGGSSAAELQVGVPFGAVLYESMAPDRAVVSVGASRIVFDAPSEATIDPSALAVLVGAPTVTYLPTDGSGRAVAVLFSPEIARTLNGGRDPLSPPDYVAQLLDGDPRGGVGLNFSLLQTLAAEEAGAGAVALVRADEGGSVVLNRIGYLPFDDGAVVVVTARATSEDPAAELAAMAAILEGVAAMSATP